MRRDTALKTGSKCSFIAYKLRFFAGFCLVSHSEPVGLRLDRLQKRDSGLIFPDFSSHSSHYAPQNHEKSSSLSHFFATIPLSPTGSSPERISATC
jgi:hypothetical protein